ncbi:MAG: transposase [Flavipsychrobacter sp.]|jgi:REP element-mobilizing transposase RayT|nr:transposase [Flavipsychrobacter sp.]
MSNHLHLICSCRQGFELSDTLRDFKKFTSKAIVDAIENNSRESRKSWLLWLLRQKDGIQFWQEGNQPEEITTDKFFQQKLKYIHQNPVRAGIVDLEEAYIYSSARDYHGIKGLIELENLK